MSFSGFVGQNYMAVEQMLKNKGYYNIKTNSVPELDKNQQEQMETVSSVVINGEVKYSRGTWFPEDAEIIINYYVLDPEHENDIQISASMNNLSGSDYISVVNRLQQDGFNGNGKKYFH